MLSFENYRKQNGINNLSRFKALSMYNMYIEGEKEIMNTAPLLSDIFVSFGNCEAIPTAKKSKPCCEKQEVENTMTNETERSHLCNRVREVTYIHERKLVDDFKPYESELPKNYKELIEWIKKDKYELNEKRCKYIDSLFEGFDEDAMDLNFNCFDGINFTARKKDTDGWNEANKALNKAKQSALDVIKTLEPTQGLKALQEFETWTYVPSKKKH